MAICAIYAVSASMTYTATEDRASHISQTMSVDNIPQLSWEIQESEMVVDIVLIVVIDTRRIIIRVAPLGENLHRCFLWHGVCGVDDLSEVKLLEGRSDCVFQEL